MSSTTKQSAVGDESADRFDGGAAGLVGQLEGAGDGRNNIGIGDRRQIDEDHPPLEHGLDFGGDLQRESGLARPTGPCQRHYPVVGQQFRDGGTGRRARRNWSAGPVDGSTRRG